jgi:hypothetical protein
MILSENQIQTLDKPVQREWRAIYLRRLSSSTAYEQRHELPPNETRNWEVGLAAELHKIYDSEINVRISCLWDGGIEVHLGDEMNGFPPQSRPPLRYRLRVVQRHFEIEKHALQSIGLVSGCIVALGYWTAVLAHRIL